MKMGQNVAKRRHMKFSRRGITQNKACDNYSFVFGVRKNCHSSGMKLCLCIKGLYNWL